MRVMLSRIYVFYIAHLCCTGAEILRIFVALLKDVLGKQQITSALLLEPRSYIKLCLVLDELVNEVRLRWGSDQ